MAIGMLVHEISVLVVIINAMRLLRRHADRCSSGPRGQVHERVDVTNHQPAPVLR